MSSGWGNHPAEIYHRQTKVWTLVRHLRDAGITGDDAAHMTDDAWKYAARAAEVNPPSPMSRRLVVKMLSGSREETVRDPAEIR